MDCHFRIFHVVLPCVPLNLRIQISIDHNNEITGMSLKAWMGAIGGYRL